MNNKKITLQNIADESGLSIGSIHALFNGSEPGGKVLRKLVKRLGLDPGIVLTGTPVQIKDAINAAMKQKADLMPRSSLTGRDDRREIPYTRSCGCGET